MVGFALIAKEWVSLLLTNEGASLELRKLWRFELKEYQRYRCGGTV